MFGTGKSPVSLNYFKAVFLSYRILAQVIQSVKKKDGDLVEQNLCAVLSRDMRAGSWHIRAAWLGLTYGECGLCPDAPAVASSLICDVHSLTFVTPLSSCSEEILVTLWNPPQPPSSDWMNGWALKFYSSLFLSPHLLNDRGQLSCRCSF